MVTLHASYEDAHDACVAEATLCVYDDGRPLNAVRTCPKGCPGGHVGSPGWPLPEGDCLYPVGWTVGMLVPEWYPNHPAGVRWGVLVVRRTPLDAVEPQPDWRAGMVR